MEVYRRGHNGPDSKSGIRQRIVGSNPTASAKKETLYLAYGVLFLLWIVGGIRIKEKIAFMQFVHSTKR